MVQDTWKGNNSVKRDRGNLLIAFEIYYDDNNTTKTTTNRVLIAHKQHLKMIL